MPSNHLVLCRPLLLLPSISPRITVFSDESALHIRWPKYWSFSSNISPSSEQTDWSPLVWTGWISLQSKGISRVLQHHSSKASILCCSAFFIVQLSHPYMFSSYLNLNWKQNSVYIYIIFLLYSSRHASLHNKLSVLTCLGKWSFAQGSISLFGKENFSK